MTSEASGSLYRPSKWTVILAFLAFILMIGVAYRAVEIADRNQQQARNDATIARIAAQSSADQLNDLQRQVACIISTLVIATKGGIENSIAQDDLLLGGLTGVDRTEYAKILQDAKANLADISGRIETLDKACAT